MNDQQHVLTWTDVYTCITSIHNQFCVAMTRGSEEEQAFTEFPLIIYGLPRGGQLVANLFSYAFSGQFIVLENAHDAMQLAHYLGHPMVIIDDIMDTGRSLQPFIEVSCVTAVLVRRESCSIDADYVGNVIDHEDYILFPWEKSPSVDKELWMERRAYEAQEALAPENRTGRKDMTNEVGNSDSRDDE